MALVLALTWPLADLAAHWSLTALVVQRLLLTLARGPAPAARHAVPAPGDAHPARPPSTPASKRFTRPVVAVVTFTVVAVGTLITPAVAAQASSAWWRAFTDVALLLGGAVLWGPVLRHIPGAHRTVPVAVAAYLFIQSVVPTFPAIIYVFARHPLYDAFRNVRVAFGISPHRGPAAGRGGGQGGDAPGAVERGVGGPGASPARRERRGRARRDNGDDGEPLTWAEVERQLERADRAERKGRSAEAAHGAMPGRSRAAPGAVGRPPRPGGRHWSDRSGHSADPIDPVTPADPIDPAEPRSPTDGPGSPDV